MRSSLFAFSILAIEQLLPLLFLVACLRLAAFNARRKEVLIHIIGLLALIAVFFIITLSGRTLERVTDHQMKDLSLLPGTFVDILSQSFSKILLYPFQILFDDYYWGELKSSILSIDFLLYYLLFDH